jgi:hypothetical protein
VAFQLEWEWESPRELAKPRASDGAGLRMCIPKKVTTNGLRAVAILQGLNKKEQVIVECTLLEMLRTRSALHFFLRFVIFLSIHKHETYCVSYIPHNHSPKVILYKTFSDFIHEAKLQDLEFSSCGIMLALKTVSDFEGFWIRDATY